MRPLLFYLGLYMVVMVLLALGVGVTYARYTDCRAHGSGVIVCALSSLGR
jgi:lipopolysaccharide export LptBFGC system permease protein LptF